MSARDRKLLMIFAPIAAFSLWWMLLMNPALDRREGLEQPLQQAQTERDDATAAAAAATQAKADYDRNYREMVKLAKAIPQSVAVSDLMRELNSAADGMGIQFSDITMGEASTTASTEPQDVAASGPVVEGLDQVPLELTFDGRFFALSDLFRAVQRFVRTSEEKILVDGRLIRINKFSFDSGSFPSLTAKISATVYAAPADEGPTGGATPVGPPGAERGDGGLKPVEDFSPATVTP